MDDAVAAPLGRPSAFEMATFCLAAVSIVVADAVETDVSDVADAKGGSRNGRGADVDERDGSQSDDGYDMEEQYYIIIKLTYPIILCLARFAVLVLH
ncbi:unnamed protein product [Rotaria sordida]|uniref:Uncharacterized protein n=1 Tax=Rotaria sordida TaxID=392033 RepID=A0A815DKI4_9BILA|nr:unnamed protein product [Rotaria sordida]